MADVRDRHPDLADLAGALGRVGVVTGLGGKVKRNRQAGLALREVRAVEAIRGFCSGVT